MKQSTRILFAAMGILITVYTVLSVSFVCEVYDTESDLRHVQYRNVSYLRALIKQNETRIEQLEQRPCDTSVSCDCSSDVPEREDVPTVEEVPMILYTLRAYQDLIGVFDATGELIQVINVYCDALPLLDRVALEEGLSFSNKDDLIRALNAYM